jgi:hypothetical protein
MLQHFIRVPVVGEDRIASVNTHHGVVTIECSFGPHVARRTALFAFADDIAFLRFGSRSRRRWSCCRFGVHRVCATCSAAVAEAIAIKFLASVA